MAEERHGCTNPGSESFPLIYEAETLAEKAQYVQLELNSLSQFDEKLQENEFFRKVKDSDLLLYSNARSTASLVGLSFYKWMALGEHDGFFNINDGVGSDVICIELGSKCRGHIKSLREPAIREFLYSQGNDWTRVADDINKQLSQTLEKLREIRRNILYPEFEHMESQLRELNDKLEMVRKQRNDIADENNEMALKVQKLYLSCLFPHADAGEKAWVNKTLVLAYLDQLKKFIEDKKEDRDEGGPNKEKIRKAVKKVCRKLYNTKSIFGKLHSKTLRDIREDLMWEVLPDDDIKLLCEEWGVPPVNRHGRAVWPSPPELSKE